MIPYFCTPRVTREGAVPTDVAIRDSLAHCRVCLGPHTVHGPTIVMLVVATKAACMAKAMLVQPERERSVRACRLEQPHRRAGSAKQLPDNRAPASQATYPFSMRN